MYDQWARSWDVLDHTGQSNAHLCIALTLLLFDASQSPCVVLQQPDGGSNLCSSAMATGG